MVVTASAVAAERGGASVEELCTVNPSHTLALADVGYTVFGTMTWFRKLQAAGKLKVGAVVATMV